ncbi:MAG: hypothetical protein AB7F99_04780 [Vicinamibacterales bacterium]
MLANYTATLLLPSVTQSSVRAPASLAASEPPARNPGAAPVALLAPVAILLLGLAVAFAVRGLSEFILWVIAQVR